MHNQNWRVKLLFSVIKFIQGVDNATHKFVCESTYELHIIKQVEPPFWVFAQGCNPYICSD